MRLALHQMRAVPGDVAANCGRIAQAAAQAAEAGASLLLAPELATTGYGAGDVIRDLAEPLHGPCADRLAEMAERFSLTLVTGFAERAGAAVYNSALLVRPDGSRLAYRKCQLYGDYEKRLFISGPDAPAVTQIDGLTIGLLVCFDIEFPEHARRLAAAGAQAILVPTALPASEHAGFIARAVVPVRAFENQLFVAYANHIGADAFSYAGLSCIVAPDGADLARGSEGEENLLVADLHPQPYQACRLANPYLEERRIFA